MKITPLILAFYMLIGSFIPKTDFSQLLHVSDMLEHYQLHKEEAIAQGQDFCLVDFIKAHVLASEHHEHDDAEDHENVPCQSPHVSVLLFLIDIKFDISDISFPTVLNELTFQNNFYLTGFIKSLIQPPSILLITFLWSGLFFLTTKYLTTYLHFWKKRFVTFVSEIYFNNNLI